MTKRLVLLLVTALVWAVSPVAHAGGVAVCPGGADTSTHQPTSPPGVEGACVARPTRTAGGPAVPGPDNGSAGYHHLGASTTARWAGVSGRALVTVPAVRSGTYDFVATRFMVKDSVDGGVRWLEGGWAANGWVGDGRPHLYTYSTVNNQWTFYDQYPLAAGARVWLALQAAPDGSWDAWLWWGDRWNLLTNLRLPFGGQAIVEQYVEVYVDPARPAPLAVPTVYVDNVQLRPTDGGPPRYWRDDIPTAPNPQPPGYCLTWQTRYDTWSAGSCPI